MSIPAGSREVFEMLLQLELSRALDEEKKLRDVALAAELLVMDARSSGDEAPVEDLVPTYRTAALHDALDVARVDGKLDHRESRWMKRLRELLHEGERVR